MKRLLLGAVVISLVSCTTIDGKQRITVSKHCKQQVACFSTLQQAIDSVSESTAAVIQLESGDFVEKVVINKSHLTIVGVSKEKTRIMFGDYAGKESAPGVKLSTPGSFTVAVRATNVTLKNLSIHNTFDFLASDGLAADDPKKISGSQAVALMIDVPSDKVNVENVGLWGYQDTLFINSGRSWFDRVLVAGNVDFIFGNGNALFTKSEIKSVGRAKPMNPTGFVTAPSTQIKNEYGFTFIDCKLTRDASVPDNSVPLGRPWHPTTQFDDGRYADPNAIGKSVFINTWMDAHISQTGWASMSGTNKDGTRKQFLPDDSRFFEFNSTGPGAIKNEKRRQLTDVENYSPKKILGEWFN